MTDKQMDALFRRHDGTSNAMNDIWRERIRQMQTEGWTIEHDDQHSDGQMAMAAGCYAYHAGKPDSRRALCPTFDPPSWWPWAPKWWKPKDRRRDLVRAGALIVAEIERLDRAEQPSVNEPKGEDHG